MLKARRMITGRDSHAALYGFMGIVCLVCLTLVSCHSTKGLDKSAGETGVSTEFSAARHFDKVRANGSRQQNLVSKVNVTLALGNQSVSTGGSLKMKRDDVIQLSLVDPVLGVMEVGRIEFTRTRVLVLDRVNKQYIEAQYSDVDFLKNANIDFNTLQSLFWNTVFEPGKTTPVADDFQYDRTADGVSMTYRDKLITYGFHTQLKDGKLDKTSITGNNDRSCRCDFTYGDFTTFSDLPFPKEISMSFSTGSKTFAMSLSLGAIRNSSDWVARTSVPGKYSKANLDKIFKQLMR